MNLHVDIMRLDSQMIYLQRNHAPNVWDSTIGHKPAARSFDCPICHKFTWLDDHDLKGLRHFRHGSSVVLAFPSGIVQFVVQISETSIIDWLCEVAISPSF
jgi:hypothetical protein